ncbi:MAG: Ultraviolet N-glycosylase/AP lyase [Steroidobacteraceae bacterium]|nr:Ultraviolet N-glycosylase/AP lyase [Steroidobacteraceae bacterium]
MTAASPLRTGAAKRLAQIDAALEAAYRSPEAELGNKPDPLDEAIYIILSFQTDLARFGSTWSRLRAAYPSWDALECASAREVARILRDGGLHRQKTRTIRRLLAEVRNVAGEHSLDLLRAMNNDEAERLLTRLPGLSWKAARCVLLYSLGREVLPIDSNTFRILKRTGVLSRRAVYRRRSLHDAIQAAVPLPRRRALHVNLVVHGQRTCLPRAPQCACCPLNADCPKVGLRVSADKHVPMPIAISVGARAAIAEGDARL